MDNYGVADELDWQLRADEMLFMASVIVMATLNVAATIISESALSYPGLGVQPPTISVLGMIFLGDWLRDVLDLRLKQ